MRDSPSVVPGIDRDVYLVLDDFGRMGCAWRETNVEDTDLEAVISDLLEGQYSNPFRVIGFNVSEGWIRDVSEEIAQKLRERCADEYRDLPDSLQQFVSKRPELDLCRPLTVRARGTFSIDRVTRLLSG